MDRGPMTKDCLHFQWSRESGDILTVFGKSFAAQPHPVHTLHYAGPFGTFLLSHRKLIVLFHL